MNFVLFLILNATLFLRPAEIVPALLGWPLYNGLILACLALSLVPVVAQLKPGALRAHPITACVLGLLVAVVLSHLAHGRLRAALEWGTEFAKAALYYLLLVAILDTRARLGHYVAWLLGFVIALAALAVLQFHGVIDLPSRAAVQDEEVDSATGAIYYVSRLGSTGIYNDPNDLCMILIVGIVLALYQMDRCRAGVFRGFWLLPLLFLGYAVALTHSRGGFLAMVCGMVAFFWSRFGWRRALPLLALAIPVLFFLFAGRQTNLSATEDTAQDRVQLWAEGLAMLRQAPCFGIGMNRFAEDAGLLAHNSFINTYAELGYCGGTLFLGAFYYALGTLHRLGGRDVALAPAALKHLRPYLMAIVAAYVGGMLSLSRAYIVPTYMVLGLATSFFRLALVDPPAAKRGLSPRLLAQFGVAGLAFLFAAKLFVAAFVRWT